MEAYVLAVGCLNALFLAALLYQQVGTSEVRAVSLPVARALVVIMSVASILFAGMLVMQAVRGGAS